VPEFCVFRGTPIPEWDFSRPFVKHLYCSRRCAQRQQNAIRKLRDTTPLSPVPEQPHG